jgi:hypothetical protein
MTDTNTLTNTTELMEEEVSLIQRLHGLPRVTSDETLVDPVEVRKKPDPASRTRPDIRARWSESTPGLKPASVSQETEGRRGQPPLRRRRRRVSNALRKVTAISCQAAAATSPWRRNRLLPRP